MKLWQRKFWLIFFYFLSWKLWIFSNVIFTKVVLIYFLMYLKRFYSKTWFDILIHHFEFRCKESANVRSWLKNCTLSSGNFSKIWSLTPYTNYINRIKRISTLLAYNFYMVPISRYFLIVGWKMMEFQKWQRKFGLK